MKVLAYMNEIIEEIHAIPHWTTGIRDGFLHKIGTNFKSLDRSIGEKGGFREIII